ncbi:hypothetical protein PRIC2_014329 [Phytophthora ramorum]
MATPTSRPSSIAIDDANDRPLEAPSSPVAAMEDLSLSPTPRNDDEDDEDYDLASASKLIPLSMTDSASGERPLPSLHSPLMYRDVPFAGLFVLHLILMLVATSSIRSVGEQEEQADERSDVVGGLQQDASLAQDDADVGVALRSLCVVNSAVRPGLAAAFYLLLQATLRAGVVHILHGGAIDAGGHALPAGVGRGLCSGGSFAVVSWCWTSCAHPALGGATCVMLVAYTIWASWICTTIGYVGRDLSPWNFSIIYLVFHFYWMSNVFKNILTIVASGTTMIWYYRNESTEISPDIRENISDHDSPSDEANWPNSFGSICIGSLLCPLAHLVWNALRWARRDESVLSRRFMSLRSERVEYFIRTYHKYSFVHVAGYNKPYYVAAQDAWKLIEHHGVEAIVDDDLTSRILLLGGNGWAGIMMIAAVIKTLFVCFAENPGRLSQLHPLIYHRFVRLAELKSFRDHKAPASTRA